jgi:hypothetical protein
MTQPDDTDLPNLAVFDTAQIENEFTRDFQLYYVAAGAENVPDVGPNTLPQILSKGVSAVTAPIYSNNQIVAQATTIRGSFGTRLDAIGAELGVPRGGATPASGSIQITAEPGGGTIYAGDVVVYTPANITLVVLETNVYVDGDLVEVNTTSTGPTANIDAGAVVQFQNQRPGIGLQAVVFEQPDGTGISGGSDAQTDYDYQNTLIAAQSDPAAAGNVAQLLRVVERTANVPVLKAFCIPCFDGAGTTCIAFLVRPDPVTGSCIPNDTHIQSVLQNVEASFNGDDGYTVAFILPQPLVVGARITWRSTVATWTDNGPWPPAVSTSPVAVDPAAAITSTSFRATTQVTIPDPQVGQTIGLFEKSSGTFVRKLIAQVTPVVAGMSWDLVFDASNLASDPYVPVAGALLSAWSDSITMLPAGVIAYFATLGPGEQFATFPDPGVRGRRLPLNPESWPSTIYNQALVDAFQTSGATSDVTPVMPQTPATPPLGTPGVALYLFELGDLAIYP